MRKKTLLIAEAGLAAIDTAKVIRQNVRLEGQKLWFRGRSFDLRKLKRIYVVGVGKCSLEAGAALEQILGKKITAGIGVDVHPGKLKRIRTYAGTHPWPTEKNIDVTKEIIKLLTRTKRSDLVIFIISGGGSTLLCQPGNFTCIDEKQLLQCLYREGATIQEENILRKHLSSARGGYLAKYAYPSQVVSLLISDVPGDNPEFIASGPTVKDTTTVQDAQKVHEKYHSEKCCGILEHELLETPKADKYFKAVHNILLVSNKTALSAMAKEALTQKLRPKIVTSRLSGQAKKVAIRIIRDLAAAKPNTVLLYGGETTVVLKGPGKGGRNQELALSGLRYIKKAEIIATVASDGRDNTDSAGAICDIITKEKAKRLKLNPEAYLRHNDSYTFFQKVRESLVTGDTGSNVSDLIIAAKD